MLDLEIPDLTRMYSQLWASVAGGPLPMGQLFTPSQQRKNELRLEGILSGMDKLRSSTEERKQSVEKLRHFMQDLVLESVAQTERNQIERILSECSNAGDEFVRRAKEFDESLPMGGVFQALRNLWIINSLQAAFGLPINVGASGFAYSLLYTYTDNHLDAHDAPDDEKIEFNEIFRKRLCGQSVPQDSRLIATVSALVNLIEAEYPRDVFPCVYSSLLAIHDAQQESLRQQQGRRRGSLQDVLGISVLKGGTSVVADAAVAKGFLTPEEIRFAFGYGVMLQFIDDLQDVKEDLEGGSETLFTDAAREGLLDFITNRLLQYVHQVLVSASAWQAPGSDKLSNLILQGCTGLILESIALNPELFSPRFIVNAEQYSPLGFESIRTMYVKAESVGLDLHSRVPSIYSDKLPTLLRTQAPRISVLKPVADSQ